jgi:hypothetical protein
MSHASHSFGEPPTSRGRARRKWSRRRRRSSLGSFSPSQSRSDPADRPSVSRCKMKHMHVHCHCHVYIDEIYEIAMHRENIDKLLVYLGTQSRSRSTPRVPRPRPVLQRFVIRRRRLALFRLLPAHQTVEYNVAFEQGIRGFEHGGRLASMCRS